jgi:hypothetical protein
MIPVKDLQIASPRLVPPKRRVIEPSTCENALDKRVGSAGRAQDALDRLFVATRVR